MRFRPAVVAAVVLLALAGCTPATPYGTDSPAPSTTPVFASDADALKAAEAAYAAYESAVDRSLQEVDSTGLRSVATSSALKSAEASVDSFKDKGRHQTGTSTVSKVTGADLSNFSSGGAGGNPLQVYACLDVSQVEVVDSSESTISEPGRQTVFPVLVSLTWSRPASRLLVSEESVWDGQDFCS